MDRGGLRQGLPVSQFERERSEGALHGRVRNEFPSEKPPIPFLSAALRTGFLLSVALRVATHCVLVGTTLSVCMSYRRGSTLGMVYYERKCIGHI